MASGAPVRAYVGVEAEVGRNKSVAERIRRLTPNGSRVISADSVTGPYDVIVHIEGEDLDQVGKFVTEHVQLIDGVKRTVTNLVTNLD